MDNDGFFSGRVDLEKGNVNKENMEKENIGKEEADNSSEITGPFNDANVNNGVGQGQNQNPNMGPNYGYGGGGQNPNPGMGQNYGYGEQGWNPNPNMGPNYGYGGEGQNPNPSMDRNYGYTGQGPNMYPNYDYGRQEPPYGQWDYQHLEQGGYEQQMEIPVTVGEWLISLLLLMIPCVNLVLLFVWAFSDKEKKSKSNFYKASLIFSGVLIGVFFLWMIFGAIMATIWW